MARRARFDLTLETEKFERFTRKLVRGMSQRGASKALRGTALEFIGRVVDRTPVRTGRAQWGWTAYAERHGYPHGAGGDDMEGRAEGLEASSYRDESRGFREPFIEIINGVVYIVPLEYGHSEQAPAGFMRITMREIAAGQVMTLKLQAELETQIAKANVGAGLGRRRE